MRLSIIVPILNEAEALPGLLDQCSRLQNQGCEVVLVDGGSDDGSVALVHARGFKVVAAPRGRARQMNAGATQSTGELLLFLHADTRLSDQCLEQLKHHLNLTPVVWGRFNVRISGRSVMLPIIARLMNLRSRLSGIATGDQAIFISRVAFDQVGGFPDQPLMEDIEISSRLRKLAPPTCLPGPVFTSGRRWDRNGAWKTIFLMWQLRWAYWRGTTAETLARRYR
ncbi:TIGR04283 family arsenosugar biosynthesis glycosyltransferase [Marinobacterium litorale]|uniref:TIGR04283 family arsenosugar biosynthesis glycosyltransferase n=1 Tax=Marinobacterium litorale TaxID=404770 RepID=UPI0003F6D175|nr:TIGR04283 family arsenosugar biosynthesis glycosyltransferase [Marinobacterium litorale]